MKPDVLRRRLLASASALLAGTTLLAAAPATAADDALNAVQQRGTLRIGIEGTYPPFNYQDEKGQFVGFEIDLGNALAETMGVKAQFQPTKWDGLLAALDSGRIDVIINQVTITDARQKKYRFSQPYTVSGIQAVTRTKDADTLQSPNALAGKKVGVGLGTSYEEWARRTVPSAEVRTYEDDPTKNQDLAVGRLDAVTGWPRSTRSSRARTALPWAARPSRARPPVFPPASPMKACTRPSTRRWRSCVPTAPWPSCPTSGSTPT